MMLRANYVHRFDTCFPEYEIVGDEGQRLVKFWVGIRTVGSVERGVGVRFVSWVYTFVRPNKMYAPWHGKEQDWTEPDAVAAAVAHARAGGPLPGEG